jgi:hypothetical protein
VDYKLEDAVLTNTGAASGATQTTAPNLDFDTGVAFDPALLSKAWRKNFSRKKESKKKVAVVIDVPSGEKVAVVRMPLWMMLHAGKVPDRLSSFAQEHVKLLSSGDAELAQKTVMGQYLNDADAAAKQMDDLLDFIWINSVVLPRFASRADYPDAPAPDPESDEPVVLNGDDDNPVFDVADVEMIDKVFVYQFCQGVDESVEQFLRTTSAALGIVADVAGLPLQAL